MIPIFAVTGGTAVCRLNTTSGACDEKNEIMTIWKIHLRKTQTKRELSWCQIGRHYDNFFDRHAWLNYLENAGKFEKNNR